MFFFLSKTLDLFLSPLFWALSLGALGIYRGRSGAWFSVASVSILYVFSTQAVANTLMQTAEQPSLDELGNHSYDAVVLLGGVVDHGPTATYGSRQYNDNVERLHVTYDLLRSGRAQHAILSGGRGRKEDPIIEGQALADQLADWGIDRSRLIVEGEAKNTRGNAVETARVVRERGFDTVLIVTSAFHMRRALESFRAADLDVDALSTDYKSADKPLRRMSWLPRASHLNRASRALRELAGRLIYRVMGYSEALTVSEPE